MSYNMMVFTVFLSAYAFLFVTIGYHGWRRLSRAELATPTPMP